MTGAPTRERPIIFSASMVRAIHAGRKTMTRRVLRLPTKTHTGGAIYERPDMGGWEPTTNGGGGCFTIGKSGERVPVPETVGIWHRTCGVCLDAPWQRGDILWVREAGYLIKHARWHDPVRRKDILDIVGWRHIADDTIIGFGREQPGLYIDDCSLSKRPSIHMPRWASRITLRVTDVRIERLQEISLADVLAEGAPIDPDYRDTSADQSSPPMISTGIAQWCTPRAWYHRLWDEINGPDAWDANPWVCVVSFERVGSLEIANA